MHLRKTDVFPFSRTPAAERWSQHSARAGAGAALKARGALGVEALRALVTWRKMDGGGLKSATETRGNPMTFHIFFGNEHDIT